MTKNTDITCKLKDAEVLAVFGVIQSTRKMLDSLSPYSKNKVYNETIPETERFTAIKYSSAYSTN